MSNRAQEGLAALACLGVAACASTETQTGMDVFVIDECAPIVELYRSDSEPHVVAEDETVDIPEGMVQVYVGTAARLPEGCT